MIDRRNFGLGLSALGLGTSLSGLGGLAGLGMAGPARAQSRKLLKLANTAVVNDAQQCFITSGQHPKLNYYAMEGLDIEYVNMSSIAQAMQAMTTEQVAFGPAAPGIFLPAIAKDPSIDLIAVYKWLPRNANVVIVKADSPIKSVAELAGKRIGVRNQGDPGIQATKTMLLELGVDDKALQFIAIGDGAPAGQALAQDRVDAMVTYDTAAARIELVGFKARYLALPPKFATVGSGWLCVKKKMLKDERKALVGLFRAIAKSTLFAHTNLEQAINLHWAVYPESKPRSKTEDEARAEINFFLKDRKNNWMRQPTDPDQRFGASSLAEWKANIESAAETSKNPKLAAEIGDANRIFSNELIDEVNAFDREAVIRQAQEFKL